MHTSLLLPKIAHTCRGEAEEGAGLQIALLCARIPPDVSTDAVIELENVTKSFADKNVVKNLTLTIDQGEVFGFLGPNGAGKTTTMKMILGLLRPTKGKISLLGEKAGTLAARSKIGFLPEFAHYYQHLTGREFLYFVGELFELPANEIDKRVKRLLKLVNLPSDAYDRQVHTYSKGMQQRIGMAQALMNDPEILFLDEPMSGLDPIGRREMKNIIIELKKAGKTIFFNSHILADAQEICDRVGIIHLGSLLLEGKVKKVVPKGKSLEDVFIETITSQQAGSSKKQGGNQKQAANSKRQTATRRKSPAASRKKTTTKKKNDNL